MDLVSGFQTVLSLQVLSYCFLGVLLGTIAGILPGLGPLATIALLLPLTYNLDVTSSLVMLSGIYYGVAYGGTATSVLMRIPGEASSVVTCIDGYEMARRGRAGAALTIAALGSFVAGTVGTLAISLLAEPAGRLVLSFGPAEYTTFMLCVLAIVIVSSSSTVLRAIAMTCLGFLVGMVGFDQTYMTPRFTFGAFAFSGGVDIVALTVGLFGLSEVLSLASQKPEETKIIAPPKDLLGFLPSREEARRSVGPTIRGTIIGFLSGLLPGGGVLMSPFISYAVEKKLSKHPEEFGKGAVEGLAGPETANNAAVSGSLLPLLCMGVPSNATTAVLLGAFIIHGVTPGPMIMQNQPEIFWSLIASMYVGNVILVILNIPLIKPLIRILEIPRAYLAPMIVSVCLIGVYSGNGNAIDVVVAVAFGFIGLILRGYKFDVSLIVIGYIAGPVLERSLRQSLVISDGDPSIFLHSALSTGMIVVVALLIVAKGATSFLSFRSAARYRAAALHRTLNASDAA